MKYKYKLKNTRFSSEQLENCEVCGKYVGEVFFQTEAKGYVSAFDKRPPVTLRWTHHQCRSNFGHQHCLESIRKKGAVLSESLDECQRLVTIVSI
jgi:hypothetical protein